MKLTHKGHWENTKISCFIVPLGQSISKYTYICNFQKTKFKLFRNIKGLVFLYSASFMPFIIQISTYFFSTAMKFLYRVFLMSVLKVCLFSMKKIINFIHISIHDEIICIVIKIFWCFVVLYVESFCYLLHCSAFCLCKCTFEIVNYNVFLYLYNFKTWKVLKLYNNDL